MFFRDTRNLDILSTEDLDFVKAKTKKAHNHPIKLIIIMCLKHCMKSVQIRRFFWSVFPCIRTEYGDLRSKSPYSVRIQENTDQKKLRIWTLFTQ